MLFEWEARAGSAKMSERGELPTFSKTCCRVFTLQRAIYIYIGQRACEGAEEQFELLGCGRAAPLSYYK